MSHTRIIYTHTHTYTFCVCVCVCASLLPQKNCLLKLFQYDMETAVLDKWSESSCFNQLDHLRLCKIFKLLIINDLYFQKCTIKKKKTSIICLNFLRWGLVCVIFFGLLSSWWEQSRKSHKKQIFKFLLIHDVYIFSP